jgi:hypothetical protein
MAAGLATDSARAATMIPAFQYAFMVSSLKHAITAIGAMPLDGGSPEREMKGKGPRRWRR